MIAGIETGGTKVVCAIADRDRPSEPLAVKTVPTTGPGETFDRITSWIAEVGGVRGPEAIGLAAFGPLDMDTESSRYGRVLTSPKAGWDGADVVSPLLTRFSVPVALVTDVTGALVGERGWGAARGLADAAYLTVGTGIGAGIISSGRVVAGSGYPEIGHLPVRRHPGDLFPGVCRFHGDCLEGVASGPAIRARWGASLPELAEGAAREAAGLEAYYLAQLICTLTYTLGTRTFVLGGGVANWPGLRDEVARVAREVLDLDAPAGKPLVIRAPELAGLSGVVGALTAAADLLAH
jgi:fructokinase